MKIECYKIPEGFIPVDYHAEKLKKIPNGAVVPLEFKQARDYEFHKKVFAFFAFCFEHWSSDKEFMDEAGQFDFFRKNMTALAGYYDTYVKVDGSVRVEARSISYTNMSQDEFESFYHALVNCAMRTIFKGADQNTYEQLMGFF